MVTSSVYVVVAFLHGAVAWSPFSAVLGDVGSMVTTCVHLSPPMMLCTYESG